MSSRRRLPGPRWGRDSEGLQNEGTDCEAGPSVTPDFIFLRLFFEISSHLTSCSDALGLRAQQPGSGLWEGSWDPHLWTLGPRPGSFGTTVPNCFLPCPTAGWPVFLQTQAAPLHLPHSLGPTGQRLACLLKDVCFPDGRTEKALFLC